MGLNVNWGELATGLKDDLLGDLRGVVEGTTEDLRAFGLQIAVDLVRAVREKRPELIDEIRHQVEVLAEVQRIRLVAASWDQVGKVVALVGRVALRTFAAVAI